VTGGPASVLVVHNAYRQRGGEETVLATESALLARHGHRVGRLIVDNREIADRPGASGKLRLAAETVWSARSRRMVARAIDQFGPDVVHVHNTFPRLSPAIYGACRDAGVPVVQTIHNFRLVCPSSTLFRDGRECRDCVGRPALPAVIHACYRGSRTASATVAAMLAVHRVRRTWHREVDAYLVYSAWAAALLERGGLPPERIHIRSQFVRDRATRQGPGEPFLFVGRLTLEKGVPTLLAAWQDLPDLELRVAGDGPLAPDVAASSADRRITPLGFVDAETVHRELLGARALVFTSRTHEMAPLTVIEAYAAGVPVIAPSFGVLPSLVDHEVTGLLYLPGDAASLASTVRWAAEHPSEMEAMGAAARRRFEDRHTEEGAYATLAGVYRQVIARAGTA
jgi:glycosyltransferase involved in cell wall biosynthesis